MTLSLVDTHSPHCGRWFLPAGKSPVQRKSRYRNQDAVVVGLGVVDRWAEARPKRSIECPVPAGNVRLKSSVANCLWAAASISAPVDVRPLPMDARKAECSIACLAHDVFTAARHDRTEGRCSAIQV